MRRDMANTKIGGARSGRYFGGVVTNKFDTKYHTIQKEILKYLKH